MKWRLNMKYNIILWGTGERAKYRIKEGCFEECNIVGFIDTYKKEDSFMGYEVFTPEMLIEKIDKVDYLVIVTKYWALDGKKLLLQIMYKSLFSMINF